MILDLQGRDIGWEALPKQALALEAPALELCYGGEKAGGKTEFIVVCWTPLLMLAAKKFDETGRLQHKCRIIVFRKNLDDLKDWVAKSHAIYPVMDPSASWHSNDKTWTFSSGATVTCRHLDGPTDHLGYNGQELPGIGFDQVEQIPYEAYSFIAANCRSGDPDYWKARIIRSTANPGGLDWVAKHFHIDECPEGGKIFEHKFRDRHGKDHVMTRVFIRARLHENKYIDPAYEAQLRGMMSADEQAMYLEGDFFRVAGAFFSKFLRPSLHFVQSRPIQSTWEMGFGMDWGSTNPAALYVGALDPEGCLWIVDELYGPGETGRRFGEKMRGLWDRQTWCPQRQWKPGDFYGVIDKQAMDRYGSEATAAAGIMEHGFRLFPAEKDRLAGCNQMKERFLLDRAGNARTRIFEDKCPSLVRALSKIKSNAPEKPDEYDPKSEYAHGCDGYRFLAMRFPVHQARAENVLDAEVARWSRILQAQKPTSDTGAMSTGYGD